MTNFSKLFTLTHAQRLFEEWEQHKKIIIGVDYDDTISPWRTTPQEICNLVIKEIIRSQKVGAFIVIHTACDPSRYMEIREYCNKVGIKVDSINQNPIDLPYGTAERSKIFANIFLDDRGGLGEALTILKMARDTYFNKYIAYNQQETEI